MTTESVRPVDTVRHSPVTLCGIHNVPDPTCLACGVCANYPDCTKCLAKVRLIDGGWGGS